MTTLDDLPLRSELKGRSPYGAPQLDVEVRLNTNENPYSLPEPVAEAVEQALAAVLRDLNRYPDREAEALRADLAAYLGAATGHDGLTGANLWAANGSNEVQQQLLQVFGGPGHLAMGFSPSYSMHEILAAGTGTQWHDAQRGADFALRPESASSLVRVYQPDIVFLCSPNNPTGTALDLEVIESVAREAPGVVVVDEAYGEFAREGTPSAVTLLPKYPRLIVTRTMSKAFAFAGVRLGYLAADPAVVQAVQLVRLPYHLSALTQAAARAALANSPLLLAQVEAIKTERDRIVAGLRALDLTVADSDANFVLFATPTRDQQATWQALLDRSVLVRDVGLPGWLRVTAGTHDETTWFLEAMAEVVADQRNAAPKETVTVGQEKSSDES
ncbi:histidinol-phosphate transaminase [Luedemannella flava]|uniref:Histidinol-phosphate aminotransferase n=1 Tax=Luedemannella flava TaxID=349316 RepID=A0ABN2LV50_9ACTN